MIEEIFFDLKTVYGDSSIRTGHFGVHYRGVPCVKCPFDYVLYQMIINQVKPDLIIEIGTYKGGSSLYYSDILNILGGEREVHTIDIEDLVDSEEVLNNKNIKRFLGGYQNYDLNLIKNFSKILVIDDGSHHYSDVIGALNKFSTFVSKDSYFIVEDGVVSNLNMESYFDGGPQRGIKCFLSENQNFIIDRHYCDFFGINATFNPNGFIKKIM